MKGSSFCDFLFESLGDEIFLKMVSTLKKKEFLLKKKEFPHKGAKNFTIYLRVDLHWEGRQIWNDSCFPWKIAHSP